MKPSRSKTWCSPTDPCVRFYFHILKQWNRSLNMNKCSLKMSHLKSPRNVTESIMRNNRMSSPSHQEKQSQHVRHFHFHGWPEIGIPAEGRGMIDIIAAVQRQQQQSGNRPIIVHCRWGNFSSCSMMRKITPSVPHDTFIHSSFSPLLPGHLNLSEWCLKEFYRFIFLPSVTINSTFCLSRPGVLCLNHLCDPL